jgi:hypothetical protein
MNPVITMFKLSGVDSIVLWNENQTFPNTVAEGVLSFAAYNGIPVTQLTVPPTPTQDDINNLVGQIKELAPEGVIGAAYAPACPKVVKAMKSLNYMPKGWAQTECISEPSTKTTAPDALYGIDKSEFDRRMTGPHWTDDFWYPPSADGTPSPELVYRDLVNTFNEVPQGFIACTMGAGLVLHKVLEKVGTIQTSEVLTGIQLFNEPSFMGQIGFSAWGQNNVKDVIVFQADKSFDLQIIYPLGSATSNYLFPAPTFDERVFQGGYMNKASEIALAAVTGFFILVSLGLTVWLIIFRNHRVLTAASPLFLGTILFGSLLLYSTVYAWVLNASTVACYLRFWLLGVGFVVMFGALFAKTYRIMRIFTTTDLRVFKITNLQLILVLLILVGVEVVLLAIWSATSRPVRTLSVTDPIRPSKDVWVCSTGKSGKVMLGILVAYKLCIVLFGIYMSIRIWKIPLKQFNESRAIAFSMYNMLCFGILAFGLQVGGAISDPAMYIVRSVCLILSTFFTLAAIFGPKVVAVITGHTGYSSKSNSGGTTNGTRGHLETLGSNGTNGTNGTKEGKESYYGSAYEPSPEKAEAISKPSVEEALDELKKKYAKLKKKYNALVKGGGGGGGGNKAKDEADSGSLLSETASSPPSSPAVAPKSPSNRKNTRSNSK